MEKVIRNNEVAVLYAPDYGAGWYSWNLNYPECLFDPEIVALVEAKADAKRIQEKAEELWPRGYWGAADQLEIEWIPVGTRFEIHEYDGNESIEIYNDARPFLTA